jgi:hypothetical protein
MTLITFTVLLLLMFKPILGALLVAWLVAGH